VFKVGKPPINVMLAGYHSLVKSTYRGPWQLRSQLTLSFRAGTAWLTHS
jgi:hypothetical protein